MLGGGRYPSRWRRRGERRLGGGAPVTEQEWLACDGPVAMWMFARAKVSDRKGRLFACACCRQVWELMTDPRSRAVVEFVERHADAGPKGKRGFPALRAGAWDATEDAFDIKHGS